MVVIDAVARLLPARSPRARRSARRSPPELEGGFEYPQFHAGPPDFRGWGVPEVLLSHGDHGRIEDWRREQSRARSIS